MASKKYCEWIKRSNGGYKRSCDNQYSLVIYKNKVCHCCGLKIKVVTK